MTRHNDFVFHGSEQRGLSLIPPSRHHARDDQARPMVFASRYKAMACCYMLPIDPEMARVFYDQDGHILFVTSDAAATRRKDKGGSLYQLSGEGFSSDNHGMEYMEWLCPAAKEVLKETPYPSALQAMKTHGVKCFAVTPDYFRAMRTKMNGDTFMLLSNNDMAQLGNAIEAQGTPL